MNPILQNIYVGGLATTDNFQLMGKQIDITIFAHPNHAHIYCAYGSTGLIYICTNCNKQSEKYFPSTAKEARRLIDIFANLHKHCN